MGQMVQFCAECNLIDGKLKATDCSMIFSKVKIGKRNELNFERFQEACRMMCAKKGVTYQNLVQIATGQTVSTDGEADFGMEIDNRLSSSGGRRLTVEDFELLKVLGKGSFGKVST